MKKQYTVYTLPDFSLSPVQRLRRRDIRREGVGIMALTYTYRERQRVLRI